MREPKLRPDASWSLWSQIKTPHRSPNQRPFSRVLLLFLSFQSWEAFVDCTNEPVIRLLYFPWRNGQNTNPQMHRVARVSARGWQSRAQHILTQHFTGPRRSRATKTPGITAIRTISRSTIIKEGSRKKTKKTFMTIMSKPRPYAQMVYYIFVDQRMSR